MKIILKQKDNKIYVVFGNESVTYFENKTLTEVEEWIHSNLKNCQVIGAIAG